MSELLTLEVTSYLLVFARLGAILMLVPGFGDEAIAPRVRLIFALLFALIVTPISSRYLPPVPQGFPELGGLLLGELLIGLMIGAIIRILFSALQVAGTIIGLQSGLGAAMIFDPAMGQQSAIFARFLSLLATLLIFVTGLHQMLLAGAVRSYILFQPGGGVMIGDFAELAIESVSGAFLLGVQMSAPFLVYGIVFNVGLGILSRLAPQIQIFFIAQPLNILFAFMLLLFALGAMMTLFLTRFGEQLAAMVGAG